MSETTIQRSVPQSSASALLSVASVPIVAFLCFGVGIALGVPSDRIALLGLSLVLGSVICTVFAIDRIRRRERRNLLISIFSFSYLIYFVLPALVFYVGQGGYDPDLSPNPVPLTPAAVTGGMLAALLGYLTLIGGFFLPVGSSLANGAPRMRREWSPEAAMAVALIAIPMGWAVLLASQLGMIPARAGSGVLGTVASGTTYGIGLIVLCYERYRSRAALLLLLLLIPPTMFFNFFTSSKGLFLRPLVLIAVVHVIVTRRLRAWWIAGFIALITLLYPVSMEYRHYMQANHLRAVEVAASPSRALDLMASIVRGSSTGEYLQAGLEATARRLDGLGILSVIVRDAGTRVPLQHGTSIAYIPMSYIPRLLWPNKPRFETGQWVTDNFGMGPYIESSTGCTWVGEFFFNFGWGGILIGMALLGIWFRFLQELFLRIDATIPSMLAGIVTILVVAPGLEGDLLGPINGVIFNVTPIVLMHLLVSTFTPRPVRLPPPL